MATRMFLIPKDGLVGICVMFALTASVMATMIFENDTVSLPKPVAMFLLPGSYVFSLVEDAQIAAMDNLEARDICLQNPDMCFSVGLTLMGLGTDLIAWFLYGGIVGWIVRRLRLKG